MQPTGQLHPVQRLRICGDVLSLLSPLLALRGLWDQFLKQGAKKKPLCFFDFGKPCLKLLA